MADTPTPDMASNEEIARLARFPWRKAIVDKLLNRLDYEIAERKKEKNGHASSMATQRQMLKLTVDLQEQLAAERARISMIQSRLTQATDGTLCSTLHDVGSWHDWAERLLAEIADTGPAKGGT
jgi:hypothetical protein